MSEGARWQVERLSQNAIDPARHGADLHAANKADREDRIWTYLPYGPMATLEDYAFMIRAAIKLYETTGNILYVTQAEGWMATLDEFYLDRENGGYFFTASDAENLIIRRKTVSDNATPSGNGILAEALARLYFLTGNDSYRFKASSATAKQKRKEKAALTPS